MTRLLILRHGQTVWNATDRVQGHTDVALDDVGLAQAEAVAAKLASVNPDLVVSSDLARAADTAAALGALTGLEIFTDERLRERFYGEWQGCFLTEIAQRWPHGYARWRAGEPEPHEGVEPLTELSARVIAGLRHAVEKAAGGTVVVVTHGGAARQGLAGLLEWPAQILRTVGGLGNCHWSELRLDPARGWQLRAHNVG